MSEPKTWETPVLTFIGHVADLVQGGGKTGVNIDGEGTFKPGAG